MNRRTLLAALPAVALLSLALPPTARADDPTTPIATLNNGLLAVMRAGRSTPFESRMQTLQPVVEQAFDLHQILQNSVGPRFASFPPAAQQQLLDVFTRFTVASWVANFDSFDGQTFRILPEQRKVGSDDVVETQLVPRDGAPTKLDYVMRQSGGNWKAIDILLDGSISRVAVQRSDFRSVLSGGDPGKLVTLLRDKTTALAAGGKSS